ncbi:MAG: hypothetical protein AB1489_39965 [Acidobacteriota bacterium]
MKKSPEFDVHFQQGVSKFESGRFAESLEEFFSAAQIDPTSSTLHYYIGEALERFKQQPFTHTSAYTEPLPLPAQQLNPPYTQNQRRARRYQTRVPIIVVAYDSTGKFFAELVMTRVTSVKGACLEMQRRLKAGAQLMIFTIDSRNAVPALVRNVKLDEKTARYLIGIEFLKGPIDWLIPQDQINEDQLKS